jgi:hypothetical protein
MGCPLVQRLRPDLLFEDVLRIMNSPLSLTSSGPSHGCCAWHRLIFATAYFQKRCCFATSIVIQTTVRPPSSQPSSVDLAVPACLKSATSLG